LFFFFFFFFFPFNSRRRRLKRDVASSTMSPHSPLLACEQNVDDSAAILQRSLNSHLAAAAAVVTADASSSASICNAIQLPTWRLADDFVPHPTSRTTKALGSALRAPLVEPAMRVFADDDDDEYTALHARYELRERIVRALWIVSLPMRAQSHRDPRNDYRQVLRSHPDEAAAIVAENGVRLTKRARNALEPAVVESSIDIPAEPVTEPVEPQALPLFSFAPAKKPSVNRRRAVKSTSATTRRRRERDRLRRRRR
jgi:hypothetical protein